MTKSAARTVSTGVAHMKGYAGMPSLVIAVDGPAGSGKSTAARQVAATLGVSYLDTGAMYRALTWWLQEQRVELTDTAAVLARIAEPRIEVGTHPERPRITVDGQDVAGPIRTRQVSNSVSTVAAIPQVRAMLIGRQRDIIAAAEGGIVAEGRDIGTVVAPDAAVKVYLTASEEVRAQRRSADLANGDPAATVAAVQHEQARRDQRDAAQMAIADDAVQIDTTGLTLDQVVGRVVDLVRSRQAVSHG
ncbi:MAG TPA: (d)CMP kinase [Streptosporangiaceae bacterium]|nr:(d)CMP kinase [Streptosporangiaceae bacterium]